MTEEEKDNTFVEKMIKSAKEKFGESPTQNWKFTSDEFKVFEGFTPQQKEEFDTLNNLLIPGGLFIKPCTKCEGNKEFKKLNPKAEFHIWRYRKIHDGKNAGTFVWDTRDFGGAENIFLKQDGQWMWGSRGFDGKKYKVPRGMKCKRKGMLEKGSNCAEGYTCDRKELKCVKKGTESKREFKIPKMFHRTKEAGRSRKKKRKRKRKRTKKKRRRRRR